MTFRSWYPRVRLYSGNIPVGTLKWLPRLFFRRGMSRPVMWDRWYDTRYVRHVSVWACEQAKWTLVFLSMCCQRERWMFYCIFIHGTLIFFEIWGNCPCHFAHVMHLSMSCPNGGSAGIYELLTRRRCPCQGKFDFFLTRASPRVGIIDILDQGGLTCHRALPKEKGKQNQRLLRATSWYELMAPLM